jgi:hypothetical protein
MPSYKRTASKGYHPHDFGKKEVEMRKIFDAQLEDARQYFLNVIKPRLDLSYKLYVSYKGDRQKEIQRWQANVFVPYVQAVVETLMPRILDARPEFTVKGRSEEDHAKAEKQQQLVDYFWEMSKMDMVSEDFVKASLVYGTGFLQVSWKKDVRRLKFLSTKDFSSKKQKWEEKERVFYDAPYCEWIDNYSLWYDWHNTDRRSKQYWFKRLVLTEHEIRRRYPSADERKLAMAFESDGGDIVDYAAVRQMTKETNDKVSKNRSVTMSGIGDDKYRNTAEMKMYEVFEWWRPFEDKYAVIVGGSRVPIFKGGCIPIPFDFKEAPFVEATYMKIPGEFEGVGIPIILENPQIMLNLIKNQRLDAATLSIHRMWIVNPLANVNREDLIARPFGIIYSIDPQGVREVQFSDIKSSAYREEEMLKSDMRYSSGVDDFSMGAGGGASSATEVRHLRESTLERVRLFVNHLGDAYSDVMRFWLDMSRQFFTKQMTIRVVGDNGALLFPIIEKDDLMGRFDYRASVLPSIAGQSDIKKKQDMDLFQLLINLPFVDIRKLTARVISEWGWSLDSIEKSEEEMAAEQQGGMPGEEGMEGGEGGMPPELAAMMGGGAPGGAPGGGMPQEIPPGTQNIPAGVLEEALAMLRRPGETSAGQSPFAELSRPVNLLQQPGIPPTAKGVPRDHNLRGHNRGGKVNTNIPVNNNYSTESQLLNRAFNIQR